MKKNEKVDWNTAAIAGVRKSQEGLGLRCSCYLGLACYFQVWNDGSWSDQQQRARYSAPASLLLSLEELPRHDWMGIQRLLAVIAWEDYDKGENGNLVLE